MIHPHLPSPIANELTECGWPAVATRVSKVTPWPNRRDDFFPIRALCRADGIKPLWKRALGRRDKR